MGSFQNIVYYCCVSKGGRVLYAYNGADHETENLAALCLEMTPPYHRWYFQTMEKKTFGFLMEDGYVYFAIVNESLGNRGVLRFLENLKDEFRKLAKRGSNRSMSNLSSVCLQEQLVPAIQRMVASLEQLSVTGSKWPDETKELSPSPCNNANGQIETSTSTKAPLLGKPSKQERKQMKEHIIAMRHIELEEHRRSTDRVKVDPGAMDFNDQGSTVAPVSLQKDIGSMRRRSSSQNLQKKWCRLVRIVLAIDALVCLVLLAIWLGICGGVKCIR
ncbi:phytolongin Phyl1.1-like isoform X1 [Olea europaea var. sylvestris]|uniref:phytolongin Phyl1.1-like isoform X1 n=2 Tax=Olea europaea var. sylvestris TaxID=158386 RepID=UPI000C1CE37C|nr:phytolongin Phyl1.1-like isoform X1 [Olea europaea var. sylvestris]